MRDDYGQGQNEHQQQQQPLKRSRMDGDHGGRYSYSSSDRGGWYERSGRSDYRTRNSDGGQARGNHNGVGGNLGGGISDRHGRGNNGRISHVPSQGYEYHRQQDPRMGNEKYPPQLDRSRDGNRSRDHDRDWDRDRTRDRNRDREGDRDRDHNRDHNRDYDRGHDRDQDHGHKGNRLLDHQRSRGDTPERQASSRENRNRPSSASSPLPSSSTNSSLSNNASSSSKAAGSSSSSSTFHRSAPEKTRVKTPFGYRCELANLSLKLNVAALRSELLMSRIESLDSMVFKVKDGIVVNEGIKNEEPILSEEVKAAIADVALANTA